MKKNKKFIQISEEELKFLVEDNILKGRFLEKADIFKLLQKTSDLFKYEIERNYILNYIKDKIERGEYGK